MDPEILLRAAELAIPYGIEDLLVRQSTARATEQRGEDLPLDRREMNLGAGPRYAAVRGLFPAGVSLALVAEAGTG